jgi:hypothetical protein
MQENIREQRACHAALWGPCLPRYQRAILLLHRSVEPQLHIEKDPPTVGILPHRPHDESVIESVQEGTDVKIQHPVVLPIAFPCPADRIDR